MNQAKPEIKYFHFQYKLQNKDYLAKGFNILCDILQSLKKRPKIFS